MDKKYREDILSGKTVKLHTGCGGIYIVVNFSNRRPYEVLISAGKAGGCAASQAETLGRLISLNLQAGVVIADIVKQLKNIRCSSPYYMKDENKIFSCADAVAKALQKFDIVPDEYFQPPKEDSESKENNKPQKD